LGGNKHLMNILIKMNTLPKQKKTKVYPPKSYRNDPKIGEIIHPKPDDASIYPTTASLLSG